VLEAERQGLNFDAAKVDIVPIFEMIMEQGLRHFSKEQFEQLLSRGEVHAFLSQIEA